MSTRSTSTRSFENTLVFRKDYVATYRDDRPSSSKRERWFPPRKSIGSRSSVHTCTGRKLGFHRRGYVLHQNERLGRPALRKAGKGSVNSVRTRFIGLTGISAGYVIGACKHDRSNYTVNGINPRRRVVRVEYGTPLGLPVVDLLPKLCRRTRIAFPPRCPFLNSLPFSCFRNRHDP